MPYSGDIFTIINNFVDQYNAGQKKVRADLMDANFTDIATGLSAVKASMTDVQGKIGEATTENLGRVRLATQAQAEAGTEGGPYAMTPKRTAQQLVTKFPGHFDARLAEQTSTAPKAHAIPKALADGTIFRDWLPDAVVGYKGTVKLAGLAANSGADVVQAGAFAAGFTAVSGYQRLQGGMILQFGAVGNVLHSTPTTVTFPLAFPASCNFVTFSVASMAGGAVSNLSVASITKAYFTLIQPTGLTQTCYWLALGY